MHEFTEEIGRSVGAGYRLEESAAVAAAGSRQRLRSRLALALDQLLTATGQLIGDPGIDHRLRLCFEDETRHLLAEIPKGSAGSSAAALHFCRASVCRLRLIAGSMHLSSPISPVEEELRAVERRADVCLAAEELPGRGGVERSAA